MTVRHGNIGMTIYALKDEQDFKSLESALKLIVNYNAVPPESYPCIAAYNVASRGMTDLAYVYPDDFEK